MSSRKIIPLGAVPVFRPRQINNTDENMSFPFMSTQNKKEFSNETVCKYELPKKKSKSTNNMAVVDGERTTLKAFTERDPLCNTILEVDGVDLHVHKEILAGWSPVFMAMFTSSFVETQQGRVRLRGKSLDDVQLLLNYIYPPNVVTVTKDNVMRLLPLADEFGITVLKDKCEEILTTFDAQLDLIVLANNFNMPKLMEESVIACANLPFANIDHSQQTAYVDQIPQSVWLDLYRKKIFSQSNDLKNVSKAIEHRNKACKTIIAWGTERNSYTCDSHISLNDKCLCCLSAFRTFALNTLKSIE